jgi:acyl-CoA hydrolase
MQRSAKKISARQAAELVRSGAWIDYGAANGQPDLFDRALADRVNELSDLKIRSSLTLKPIAVMEADPEGLHAQQFSWHFSALDRKQSDKGRCAYIPVNLGEIPDYFQRFVDPGDVAVIKTRPMDERGAFNLSCTNVWHRAMAMRAKTVIVETSDALPLVHGADNALHVGEVDYVIDGDPLPAASLLNPPPTKVDEAVARQIAAEIEDGACLQIGIGGMPNAVCALLRQGGAIDLGIHTEMLTDGVIDLYKAGVVTGARKSLDQGKMVASFALGSADLYAAMNNNPDVHCRAADYTNGFAVVSAIERMVSINNTTQIDLQGQAASESDGFRHLSGTGGQSEFLRGSYASKGGKSFICLSSTYEGRGQRKSRIVLSLTPGNVVSGHRSDVMYVVTEYGMVNLKAKSIAERARALISIAHPDFREELERGAYERRILPRRRIV